MTAATAASLRQLWLPRLKNEVVVVKKYPQPRSDLKQRPRKFEILYHPFDLGFRGRIASWLKYLKENGIDYSRVLDEVSTESIGLYFFSQGVKNEWLTQNEVLERTKVPYKKKLKRVLVDGLMKVWLKANS